MQNSSAGQLIFISWFLILQLIFVQLIFYSAEDEIKVKAQ